MDSHAKQMAALNSKIDVLLNTPHTPEQMDIEILVVYRALMLLAGLPNIPDSGLVAKVTMLINLAKKLKLENRLKRLLVAIEFKWKRVKILERVKAELKSREENRIRAVKHRRRRRTKVKIEAPEVKSEHLKVNDIKPRKLSLPLPLREYSSSSGEIAEIFQPKKDAAIWERVDSEGRLHQKQRLLRLTKNQLTEMEAEYVASSLEESCFQRFGFGAVGKYGLRMTSIALRLESNPLICRILINPNVDFDQIVLNPAQEFSRLILQPTPQ